MVFGGTPLRGIMSLEDDLKARTSALISQQMANWVVEIQRAIQGHQAHLVNALDELGETVARYDEKIDDSAIAGAIAEVLAAATPRLRRRLRGAQGVDRVAAIEKGTNLSEVLTHLVDEVTQHVERAAMFIVKGNDRDRLVRARLRSPGSRQDGHDPAHGRHHLPPRARLAQRRARSREPVPRHRPGARAARRRNRRASWRSR